MSRNTRNVDTAEFEAIIDALHARPRLRFESIARIFGRSPYTISRIACANGFTQTGRVKG